MPCQGDVHNINYCELPLLVRKMILFCISKRLTVVGLLLTAVLNE